MAGISIASLTGNGLFEKAKLAKEKTENTEREQEEILQQYENHIADTMTGNRYENNQINEKLKWKLIGTTTSTGTYIEKSTYTDLNEAGYTEINIIATWLNRGRGGTINMPISALNTIGNNMYYVGGAMLYGYAGVLVIEYDTDKGFKIYFTGFDKQETKDGTIYLYAR